MNSHKKLSEIGEFISDSRAPDHLVSKESEKYMKNVQRLDREIPNRIANRNKITPKKGRNIVRKINEHGETIKALIVPEIKFNSMSVGKLIENGQRQYLSKME